MFDALLRQLRDLKGEVSIEAQHPLDDDGYFDRRCPSVNCGVHFKVLSEDWQKVEGQIFCPICRAGFSTSEWNTDEQNEQLGRAVRAHVHHAIEAAIRADTRSFNQRQPTGGLISLRLSYEPGSPIVDLPASAAERLEQRVVCGECGMRFATLGIGYFCPGCGHSSVIDHFLNQLSSIRGLLDSLSVIRQVLTQTLGKDQAENHVRALLEGRLRDLVGLFQYFAEGLYQRLPAAREVKLPKNVFQRLKEGSEYWQKATGKTYEDLLSREHVEELNLHFQRRHLIEHRGAVVDQEYLDKTRDSYAVGQRLVVRERDVLRLLNLIEDLGTKLLALVP